MRREAHRLTDLQQVDAQNITVLSTMCKCPDKYVYFLIRQRHLKGSDTSDVTYTWSLFQLPCIRSESRPPRWQPWIPARSSFATRWSRRSRKQAWVGVESRVGPSWHIARPWSGIRRDLATAAARAGAAGHRCRRNTRSQWRALPLAATRRRL